MAKNTVKAYPLRLPDPLREKLENASSESGKTLRAEIIERLEASFDKPASEQADTHSRMQDIERRLGAVESIVARLDKD